MKKLLSMSLLYIALFLSILLVGVSHGSTVTQPPIIGGGEVQQEQGLTQEQIDALELPVSIFQMCISDATYPYVAYGFTTEYAVSQGFQECEQEGMNLIADMESLNIPSGVIAGNMQGLFDQFVVIVDNLRNQGAMKRLQRDAEEQKELRKKNSI
jgi:hypothetical protein